MSEPATQLRQAVAEFFAVEPSQVGPSFSLSGTRGASSITRAALDAALRRRLGVRSRAVYSAATFGDLMAELAPATAASDLAADPAPEAVAGPAVPDSAVTSAVACGVDMELVANLPAVADHWEDTFYRDTFTPAEIAYCLVQPDPPPHFCARWCAKEALRKADARFLAVPLNQIQTTNDPAGAPHLSQLRGDQATRLPHALSLSHTPLAAVAVVVFAAAPTPSPAPPPPAPAAVDRSPPAPHAPRRSGRLTLLLALAALVVAGLALYRTWPHPS